MKHSGRISSRQLARFARISSSNSCGIPMSCADRMETTGRKPTAYGRFPATVGIKRAEKRPFEPRKSLDRNNVPDAAAAGARAGEQLNQLRGLISGRNAAGAQGRSDEPDAGLMPGNWMKNQKDVTQKLAKSDDRWSAFAARYRRSPACSPGNWPIKKQQLDKAAGQHEERQRGCGRRKPTTAEPSSCTTRCGRRMTNQTAQALDAGRQLLDHGFHWKESQLGRDGMRRAASRSCAEGVETGRVEPCWAMKTESLRKARNQLDRLNDDLQRGDRPQSSRGAHRPRGVCNNAACFGPRRARRAQSHEPKPASGRQGLANARHPATVARRNPAESGNSRGRRRAIAGRRAAPSAMARGKSSLRIGKNGNQQANAGPTAGRPGRGTIARRTSAGQKTDSRPGEMASAAHSRDRAASRAAGQCRRTAAARR